MARDQGLFLRYCLQFEEFLNGTPWWSVYLQKNLVGCYFLRIWTTVGRGSIDEKRRFLSGMNWLTSENQTQTITLGLEKWLLLLHLFSPAKSEILMQVDDVIYQAWDAVFHHQMKHWEESWKYDAQRSIFDELRGVSSGDETLCRMLDITSQTKWF